ncbi:sugar kinase [Arthrobacter sp. CDRTa11]|uniref:sugar kinase n=1 Tax=Arthrobacter sp. CDRTa11 TaxID=2651199 RepID=UPI0022658CB7|nr:sugar kinase [Arthrobacter sp. CDRTa11]UZX01371.1 sugar kinase [Arthrobacter sp. CDRTa11]
MDVLTFGETMIAFRADRPLALNPNISATIAGAESNVAIALARLGHSVQWAGRVGNDAGGALIRRTLRAESVGQDHVTTDPFRQTGILIFEKRLPDVTSVDYYRQNSAGSALSSDDVVPALAGRPHILHITGITPALSDSAAEAVLRAASAAQQEGATVTLDVNYRSKLWTREEASAALSALVPHVDVVIGSADELDLLIADPDSEADAVSALLSLGVREVVLKRGAGGATLSSRHGTVHSPARPVTAVDSVGAGDAFTAGYISGLLTGLTAEGRLRLANTLGAFAVTTKGDWEGLPTLDELALLDAGNGTVLR